MFTSRLVDGDVPALYGALWNLNNATGIGLLLELWAEAGARYRQG